MKDGKRITREDIQCLIKQNGITLKNEEISELFEDFFCFFTEDVNAMFCRDSWGVHIGKDPSTLSFAVYENESELGADHRDNGCRERDDSDENVGEFIIGAHKDGIECGKTALHQFKTGRILMAV